MVSSSLSQNKIGLSDTATLTITINKMSDDIDVSPPTCTPDGLQISYAGRGYSVSNINGAVTSTTNLNYLITPLQKGRYILNEVEVTVNGVQYATPTQRLEVTDSVRRPSNPWARPRLNPTFPPPDPRPRADDVILEAELEPEVVYEHQPTFYTLRLLSSVRLSGSPHGSANEPTGFLTVSYPQSTDMETRNGRTYDVAEAPKAFFPLTEGEYTFDPTELLIRSGFFGQSQTLRTEPKKLRVLPLPAEGRPESFTGAVGEEFTIKAELDKQRVRAGQTVVLEVEVEGDGHLDLVPYPYLPDWPGVEKRQLDGDSDTQVVNGQLVSRRTYRYRLKIKQSGEVKLDNISLAYFRPSEEHYEVVKVQPLTVLVEPGLQSQDETLSNETLLPPKERPRETPGSTLPAQTHLPATEWIAAAALGILGSLAALLGAPWSGGPWSFSLSRGKLGRPRDLVQLETTLRTLAPGNDSVQRAFELEEKGWQASTIEKFERVRKRASSLRYGSDGSKDNAIQDLLQEFESLAKEVGLW